MTIEYVTTYWPVIEDTAWNLAFTDNSSTHTTKTDSTSMPIKSGEPFSLFWFSLGKKLEEILTKNNQFNVFKKDLSNTTNCNLQKKKDFKAKIMHKTGIYTMKNALGIYRAHLVIETFNLIQVFLLFLIVIKKSWK